MPIVNHEAADKNPYLLFDEHDNHHTFKWCKIEHSPEASELCAVRPAQQFDTHEDAVDEASASWPKPSCSILSNSSSDARCVLLVANSLILICAGVGRHLRLGVPVDDGGVSLPRRRVRRTKLGRMNGDEFDRPVAKRVGAPN